MALGQTKITIGQLLKIEIEPKNMRPIFVSIKHVSYSDSISRSHPYKRLFLNLAWPFRDPHAPTQWLKMAK